MKIEDSIFNDISQIPKFDSKMNSKDIYNYYNKRESINEISNFFWNDISSVINRVSIIQEQRDNLILLSKGLFEKALISFNKTN